jgi:phospholipid/cholesterol/gamma-HCH transport system ATP-binding protein
MASSVEIKDLCKNIGEKVILDNINLNIEDKKSLVVLGRSGVGKSVLIKNICALMEPTSGSIKVHGLEITKLNTKQKLQLMSKFGFLFQGSALFDSMTVWENIAFSLLNNLHYNKDVAKKVAIEKLEMVDMDKYIADLYPSELSGGMQKRVALARAIACNPSIIFFDEPTTGLDPITSQIINELIVRVKNIVGATTITITHDIKSAMYIADRIIFLNDGRIEWDGMPDKLESCENEMLRQFLV